MKGSTVRGSAREVARTLCACAVLAATAAMAEAPSPDAGALEAATPRFRIAAVALPNGAPTTSLGVNDRGVVVGYADRDAFVAHRRKISTLAPDPGHRESAATAVNASGMVSGYDQETFTRPAVAFVLVDGRRVDLVGLGGESDYARAINDAGWVAGQSTLADHGHAAVWKDGQVTDLDPLLPSNLASEARAINAAGDVAGDLALEKGANRFESFAIVDGVGRAFQPFGARNSTALAINASRVVCGHYVAADGAYHGYCWQDGHAVDIGTLAPSGSSYAFALNDAGVAVGAATDPDGQSRAILWKHGHLHDLNDLIDPASGWTLQTASAISPDGRITGQGILAGMDRSFVLTPLP